MPDPVLSNTLKASTRYKHGKVYGQAYFTSYGWSLRHIMQDKSKAYDTLSMMFKRDGVPTKMVVDKPKEQSLGGFSRKFREDKFH